MLTKWYKGKKCSICGKTFGEITWLDHKPALRSPGKPSLEWSEIPPEKIPNVLATDMPVCWDCHIAERFRRDYPELIVDRRGITSKRIDQKSWPIYKSKESSSVPNCETNRFASLQA
jgi:hypothetical protein